MERLPNCYRCGNQPCTCKDGICLYHADCREVLPLLEPGSVDLVLTDPPYNMKMDVGKLQRIGHPDYEWHEVEHSGGVDVPSILSMNKPTVLFGANGYSSRLPDHPGWIVWDKQADGFAQGSPCELAWTNYLHNIRLFRLNYRGFTTKLDPKEHPMQKPLSLFRWILTLSESPPGTVCDPYCGSGTTGRACKDLGRKCIMVEIEEKYCRIAANRLRQEVLF